MKIIAKICVFNEKGREMTRSHMTDTPLSFSLSTTHTHSHSVSLK